MADQFRKRIGSYELLDPIGNPQESRVFEARNVEHDEPVALKALPLDFFHAKREFEAFREATAKAAAQLKHPHILMPQQVIGKWSEAYLVMERIQGPNIRELVAHKPPEIPAVNRMTIQLLNALQFLHQHKFIHRNIKATNVLVRPNTDVLLSDMFYSPLFVRWRKEKGFPSVEAVRFVSPEECLERKLVPASDVYSLGIVLFLAYTRVYPIRGQSALELQQKHVKMNIRERPDIINPHLPQLITDMLMKMIAKPPRKRYKDLGQLILDLRRLDSKTSTSGVMRRM